MQDLMKQIIEMDRKARKITEAAQQEKVNSEKDIQKNREEMRRKYLEEARKRIAINEPLERAAMEQTWEELKSRNAVLSENLDRLFSEKGDGWVSEIVKRVTGE